MKFRLLLISILICSVMLFSMTAFAYTVGTEDAVTDAAENASEEAASEETASDGSPRSSFEYKKYSSHEMYRGILRLKMPDVYRKLAPDLNDDETIPIPGTLATCTSSDGGILSDSYVPQGMCRAGSYWLVTAYDSGKEFPSVIYVVDPVEKQLVSTLILPNTYHVGGIACDGTRIWLTGDTSDAYKGSPFVQYIRYDEFLGLIEESVAEVTEDSISENIYIKNKPSFLECEGGKLWVGTYIGTKGTKEGYAYGYPISDEEGREVLNTTLFSVITAIDSSAQGMDIEDEYLYVSSSYKGSSPSIKSSFVTKYQIRPIIDGAPYLYVGDRELKRVEVPKMNEEILVEDDLIHINFESSAEKWKRPVIRTDRILAVSKP